MKLALTAAMVAAMLPSSLATPIDWFGTEGKKAPTYCDPDQGHSSADYYWNEQSEVCQDKQIAESCCLTEMTNGSGQCKIGDQDTMSDLLNVLNQHIRKDGQYDTTEVGQWTASYDLFRDDHVSLDVLSPWFMSLNMFKIPAKVEGDLLFTATGKDADTRVRVVCNP